MDHIDNVYTLAVLAVIIACTNSQYPSECASGSCYPATGDLLIGRQNSLSASSTCGMDGAVRYCIVSHLKTTNRGDVNKCFSCDSHDPSPPNLPAQYRHSHRVEEIVATFPDNGGWWQAENGVEVAHIQLNLGAEFHFTHLIMKFKTFRPAAMFIERSYDFGKTWKVYRYFAYDCEDSFPGIPLGPVRNINDVICESRYSGVEPSTKGEVIFRVLPPYIRVQDPYSEEVQDLLKMTNLRVNFTKLHTLGDNLLDSRDEIKEKYYYAMYEMVVRGSCSCYGHASRCVPANDEYTTDINMVHGQCECTHHTHGRNCEKCQDFYNDQPWRPAQGNNINECQPCDCHSHSDRCHFDPSVYELTGRVSGGVCDHCRDNTTGRQCDECEPFFYLHPSRDIRDRDACRACNCDPVGSEHGGECQGRTDPMHNLVAGKCICKRYVQGDRCDICENGFWNMQPDNPEGCEACTCNTLGTVGNYGCDKRTGECRCKRYVTGRMCGECHANYWGLSEDAEGCKPCDCDLGGSVDGSCDQSNGQCTCKPNIVGRRCDQPAQAYFVSNLDYYVYEAEFAEGTGRAMIEIRTLSPGMIMTWTGTGFMRVMEGDSITFNIDNLPTSMEYDIIIRYESQMNEDWQDVRLTIQRPGPVDSNGPCANYMPRNDYKGARLSRGNMYYTFTPSSCLETGVDYDIRIDFNSYNGRHSPDASILIDSIVIAPVVDRLDMYEEDYSELQEFHQHRCYDYHMPVRSSDPPESCNTHYFSIGASTEGMALACDCDGMGSYSHVCSPQGGQCECKPNVIGRRCDQCAPGNYGFSPEGCMPCECNVIGSSDLMCDKATGQCACNPNVYGRRCDECQRGFWGYPNCQQCRCNGRADICDNESGHCRDCRDNTAGVSCSMCRAGFYGDPNPGSAIGCRQCMCPGGEGSDYQHGDTCQLDTRVNAVVCDCREGYTGYNCDRCSDNYFGNPTIPGGTCDNCMCNDNIDPDVSGSCDASSGECLRCLYNTEGFSCEQCVSGYYGDATRRNCQACVCNILGTDIEGGSCERTTGQCPCLPNVIGQSCDRCEADHWKIASGMGCDACNCDPIGTINSITQCNEFDGQCPCVPGRGGRDCSECEANFWGDPDDMCVPCECHPDGSSTLQCDRRTGQCVCEDGVAGLHCDICDRGTTGQLPNCMPCGECFDNWDRIITELANMTNQLVQQGENIKFEGPPGAFEDEFRIMEENLDEIRRIIAGANITSGDLDTISDQLATIRQNLTSSSDDLGTVESDISRNLLTVDESNRRIEELRNKVADMKIAAQQLKDNATIIRELDVSGAFNSTQESLRRSREAERMVENALDIVSESEDTRDDVSRLIEDNRQSFEDQYRENRQNIYEVSLRINSTHDNITILNEMVCDSEFYDDDQCDAQCGGALCGKCGGVSCGDGAVQKSVEAQDFALNADTILKDKYAQTSTLLQDMESAELDAADAKSAAQEAFDNSMEAKNTSENARDDLQRLIEEISDFLNEDMAQPSDIRMIAEEVLAMTISLTSEEIHEWAMKINETIRSLTDIDTILDATRDNLNTAQELKRRADLSKEEADNVLNTAQLVIQALLEASAAQDDAATAIDGAAANITAAENDLTLVEETTIRTKELSNTTLHEVEDLTERMRVLKQKYVENQLKVENAEREAQRADDMAQQAQQDASELETKYNSAQAQLEEKYNQTLTAKERADRLLVNATALYSETRRKLDSLVVMGRDFTRNEKTLIDLTSEIRKLNILMITYHGTISRKADFHRTCSTV